MCFCEMCAKCLIANRFMGNPKNLWITLLISGNEPRKPLENQGFGWNAYKKSKFQFLYKSTTYTRYGFCSAILRNGAEGEGA